MDVVHGKGLKQMKLLALRYLLGNIVYAGAQFIIVIVLSKFGSPASVGQYALGLAVTAPVFMLSHLHLRSVLIVDTSGQYAFGEFLGLRLQTTAVALAITTGITLLGGFDAETTLVIVLISVYRVIESVSDILLGILQKNERLDQIAVSRVAKGLCSMIIFTLVFLPTQSLVLALLIMIIGWLGITIVYEGRKARALSSLLPVWGWRRLLPLLRTSAPLGIVLAIMSLNTNIPQYVIVYFWGKHDLGLYASLSYMIVACNVVVTALGEAVTPRLAQRYAAGRLAEFTRLLGRMTSLGAGLSVLAWIVGWAFGKELLTLLYSRELAQETQLFVWLLGSVILVFVSSFLWYGMMATGKFTVQIPLFACTAGCNALACLLLVPKVGLIGAAAGAIVSLLVQTVGSLLVLIYAIRQAKGHVQREAAA